MATAENGADFCAERSGGLALITPLNDRAAKWLKSFVSAEATWTDDTLVVELRYFAGLVDEIIDAGFMFERAALPN
jgi:hypothetical protein